VAGDRDHLARFHFRSDAAQRFVAARIALGDAGKLDHENNASTNSEATKGLKSSGFSPMPMKRMGIGCSIAMPATRSALGGAVELGEDEPGEAQRLVEGIHLAHRVLAVVRVEDEPGLMGRRGIGLGDDALHLLDLVHEVRLRREPSRGIREHDVDSLRLRRLHRVEDHGGRVALVLRDDGHVVAASPLGELLARRGAKGVARGEEHRALLRLEAARELAMVVVFPAPFTPASRITKGLGKRRGHGLLERREQPRERRLELVFEDRAVGDALFARGGAQLPDEPLGGGDTDVGGDELRLELLEEGLVDVGMGAENAKRFLPARARELEIGLLGAP
jgi:hypothetical protein